MPVAATPTVSGTQASQALGYLVQFSLEITRIAADTLGEDLADNRHIEVLSLLRGRSLSPGELRERTGMSASAVSRILRTQEDTGVVARTRSRLDGRSARVSLRAKDVAASGPCRTA
jgi:DNA-binding MarR family transcriptional regulator